LPITLIRLFLIYFNGSRYNVQSLSFLDVMLHSEHKYFNQLKKEYSVDTETEDVRATINKSSRLNYIKNDTKNDTKNDIKNNTKNDIKRDMKDETKNLHSQTHNSHSLSFDQNRSTVSNVSNVSNISNIPNRLNELNRPNRLNGLNGQNRENKLNELHEINKLSDLSTLHKQNILKNTQDLDRLTKKRNDNKLNNSKFSYKFQNKLEEKQIEKLNNKMEELIKYKVPYVSFDTEHNVSSNESDDDVVLNNNFDKNYSSK
jgi:hypothetical protein